MINLSSQNEENIQETKSSQLSSSSSQKDNDKVEEKEKRKHKYNSQQIPGSDNNKGQVKKNRANIKIKE